ncbi:hypothetical protein K0U07_02245, partial [bacterium]|nr:hypothetical protein [bacterium]
PLELSAYYTLWAPFVEGSSIAYSLGDGVEVGNILRTQNPLRSGFIAGGKWNTYHDDFALSVKYTFFYNFPSTKKEKLKTSIPYNSPYTVETLDSDAIDSKFNNRFQSLKGTISRPYFVGQYFEIIPHGGLLGAWSKELLFFDMQIDESDPIVTRKYSFNQHWWALGPYGQVECNFYLATPFAFYLRTGAGLLRCYHKVTQHIGDFDEDGTEVDEPEENSATSFFNIEPMFEVMVGVKSLWVFNKSSLQINLGWQVQTYLSHNGFQAYYSPVGIYGSYSMEGMTVGIDYSF